MSKKGTIIKEHTIEIKYVPGANPQTDATIERALRAARAGNSWTNRFRAPKGSRISPAVKGG